MAQQTPDPTKITPPRVPLIDERTGLISREWYLFLYRLFGDSTDSQAAIADLQAITGMLQATEPGDVGALRGVDELQRFTATMVEDNATDARRLAQDALVMGWL